MDYEHILTQTADGLMTIVISRPDRLNAVTTTTLKEIYDALDAAGNSSAVRAVLLKGEGGSFCSGADIKDGTNTEDVGADLEAIFHPLLEKLREMPVPIITAVKGVAAGAGCGLALAGDIVVAGKSAYFLQPFLNIGLVPDMGSTWTLPRLVGKARALAMMMLGERIYGDQAETWGLIYKAVDDDQVDAEALRVAQQLSKGPTVALRLLRDGVYRALEQDFSTTLQMERDNQRVAGLSVDHAEGLMAFAQKRLPDFRGK